MRPRLRYGRAIRGLRRFPAAPALLVALVALIVGAALSWPVAPVLSAPHRLAMGGEAAPADPDSDGYADPDRATDPPADPSGAACRTTIEGSRTVAYCHNPYPYADLVRMHTECARWWDVDADTAPVEVAPAQTVRIADRCWREVRAVWITHQKVR